MVSKVKLISYAGSNTFETAVEDIRDKLKIKNDVFALTFTYIGRVPSLHDVGVKCFKITYLNMTVFATFTDIIIEEHFRDVVEYSDFSVVVNKSGDRLKITVTPINIFSIGIVTTYKNIVNKIVNMLDTDSATVRVTFDNTNVVFLYKDRSFKLNKGIYSRIRKLINRCDKKALNVNNIDLEYYRYVEVK